MQDKYAHYHHHQTRNCARDSGSTGMTRRDIISEFEANLRRGVFCITQCDSCKKTVWPPSEFCNACMGDTSLKMPDNMITGRIIECAGITPDIAHAKNKDGACSMGGSDASGDAPYDGTSHNIDRTRSYLCLVELEGGIRLMACMDEDDTLFAPPGSPVVLARCGINKDGSEYVFKIRPLQQD